VNNGGGKVDFTEFNPKTICPILEITIPIVTAEEMKQP
jgi:hypothetical protein